MPTLPSSLAQADDPADVSITLRIGGNKLVRVLASAEARARERDQGEVLSLIDQARDVLAEQRRVPCPLDADLIAILVAFTATTNLGNTLCRLRDVCRDFQDRCHDPDSAARWREIASRLETLAVNVFDLH